MRLLLHSFCLIDVLFKRYQIELENIRNGKCRNRTIIKNVLFASSSFFSTEIRSAICMRYNRPYYVTPVDKIFRHKNKITKQIACCKILYRQSDNKIYKLQYIFTGGTINSCQIDQNHGNVYLREKGCRVQASSSITHVTIGQR